MKQMTFVMLLISFCFALPTWEAVGPYGGPMRDVVIAPSNESIIYTLSYQPYYPFKKCRIFKSTDGGTVWDFVGTLSDSLYGYCLAVDPTNANILYAGGKERIFKSNDGGVTWAEHLIPEAKDTVPDLVTSPNSSSIVYATGRVIYDTTSFRPGFHKSIDGGITWQSDTLDTVFGYAYAVAVAPSSPSTIYVCGFTRRAAKRRPRVYKSTDGGDSFSEVTNNLADSANGLRIGWAIAVHETIPDLVYLGTTSIWWSHDGGSTWSEAFPCSVSVLEIVTTPDNPSVLYAATDSMVYRSADAGTTWVLTDQTNHERKIHGLAVKRSDDSTVFAVNNTTESILKTTDAGDTWDIRINGITMGRMFCCAASQTSPEVCYIQSEHVGVYKSTDYGSTWHELPDYSSCLSVCDFAIHNSSADTVLSLEGEG